MKKQLYFCSPLESNLRTLISYCRPYFDVNATREMLEEWRPLMCPFDVTMAKAMSYCEMFLPTFDSYSRKEQTFQLWFDELMAFWEACPNQPLFEPHLFGLFARMADHTRGEFSSYPHFLQPCSLFCCLMQFKMSHKIIRETIYSAKLLSFSRYITPFVLTRIFNFDIFVLFRIL